MKKIYLSVLLTFNLFCFASNISAMNFDHEDRDLKLRQAAASGNIELVRILFEQGGLTVDAARFGLNQETQKPYSGKTALHNAYENCHMEIADILIKKGWSGKAKDANNITPNQIFYEHQRNRASSAIKKSFELLELRNFFLTHKKIGNIKILSLACGFAPELEAIKSTFSDKKFQFVGVDIIDKFDFKKAFEGTNAKIIHGDLTKKDVQDRSKEDGPFDIILLLHPNIVNERIVFNTICSLIPGLVSPTGTLFFLSTYHLREFHAVEEIMASLFEDRLFRDKTSAINLNSNETIYCNLCGTYWIDP